MFLDYGYWSVFTNYEDNDYLLIHERSEGIELPEDNWRYFDKDSNFEDRSLKVKSKVWKNFVRSSEFCFSGGLPVYEPYMTVLSDSSEPIHPMGLYKLKEDLIVSGRPVWQDVYSSATLIFTSVTKTFNYWDNYFKSFARSKFLGDYKGYWRKSCNAWKKPWIGAVVCTRG